MSSKNKGLFILGGLGLASILGYRLFAVKQQIQFEFVNAAFKFKNVFNSVLTVRFRIANPSLQTVNFESLSGNVFVGKNNIGQLRYLESLTIKPKSVETIVIAIDLSNLNAVGQVMDLITEGRAPEVKVTGIINLKNNSIPFTAVIAGTVAK